MTQDTLNNMLKDLKAHRRPKESLINYYVQTRLTKSIQSYYSDLLKAQAQLEAREARKVFKEMVRGENR